MDPGGQHSAAPRTPTPGRLGFLSGAPRVSTRGDAVASGPRAHVLGFLDALERLGWEVHPFIAGDRVPAHWVTGDADAALRRSWPSRLAGDLVRLVMGAVNARRAARELAGQVDWVYERASVFQALGRRFQRAGVPWILESNGLFFAEAKLDRKSIVLDRIARRIELAAYRDCDVVVCVTHTLKELVVRAAGIRPEKVIVSPNGVDAGFFDPARHPPRRLGSGVVIGFIGALIEWQGLAMLFDALADLGVECPDYSVVIVGEGPARQAWAAHAQAIGLAGRVHFAGQVSRDAVPALIAGFDIGYSGPVPTRAGGMYHSPLKLYECMAMSKPVLAAAYDDARAAVRENETGFLFEPASAPDLRRALTAAYRRRTAFAEMGAAARAAVLREHTWTHRVESLVAEVERVLGRRR